ncbi:MAG TPA: 30S ribosome-binding factor RbfA [Myxococcota bacterium]
MSIRTARVAEEIQKVLGERLIRGLRDPLPGFVTIRAVEVTSDFTHAKVFVSVFGSDAQKRGAIDGLNFQRGFLRGEVGKAVRLRHTPTLSFILDESAERAARVHALLDEVRVHGTVKDALAIADAATAKSQQNTPEVGLPAAEKYTAPPPEPKAPKPVKAKKPEAPKAPKAPPLAPAAAPEVVLPQVPPTPAVVVEEAPAKKAAKKSAAKKATKKPAKKVAAKKATKKPAAKKATKKPAKKVAKKKKAVR